MNEKICTIIPMKGKGEAIDRCIRSLLNSDYPNFEVIAVDDGLKKESLDVLNKFKDRIKILKSPSKGPAYARNLAARNTDAPFLAFTDGDCIVDRSWIKELAKGLTVFPEAVGCGGRQEIPSDSTKFQKDVFKFMKRTGVISDYMRRIKGDKVIEVNHNPSCNVMYKRDVFLREGGFLEGLWPGEDVELDYRLRKKGHKLIFNPKAIVCHYRPKDFRSFLRMMYRYGWAQGFLVRKYGVFRRIQALPFLNAILFLLILLIIIKDFILGIKSLVLIFFILLVYFKFNILIVLLSFLGGLWWHFGFYKRMILA